MKKQDDEFKSKLKRIEWKNPECPKCGLKLTNKIMLCCFSDYCPIGLN